MAAMVLICGRQQRLISLYRFYKAIKLEDQSENGGQNHLYPILGTLGK